MSLRIAIAGGGPAGLTAAIAARQAGFVPTVFEQADSYDPLGGGVGVQSNGLRVLRALGLREELEPYIELTTVAGVEAPPGRRVSRTNFAELDIPEPGFAVALRHDLLSVLFRAAGQLGIDVHFGSRCTAVLPKDDSVELQLADGRRSQADLLLACDGVRSAVRDSLPFKAKYRAAGEASLRTIAQIEHPDRDRIGEFWMPDGRRVGAFPLPGQRTYMFCSVPVGAWQAILDTGLEAWVRSWDDFGEPVTTLMRAVDWSSAVYDELSDLRVDKWALQRVFLLGDAAHAMTPNLGQGANSAMVDALVLINLLSECMAVGGWQQAAERYQHIRKPFVTRVQDAAWFGGRAAGWQARPLRAVRDKFFKYGTTVGALRRASMKLVAGYNPAEEPYIHPPVAEPGSPITA